MENLTEPQVISQPFANSGAKNTIPENPTGDAHASVAEGFPPVTMLRPEDGGEAPYGQDFNGVFNLMSQFYFFVQNGGMYTFNPDVAQAIGGYPLGARLFYTDANGAGSLLRSVKANNMDNFIEDPSVIGTSWLIETTSEKYVDDNFVSIATPQTITGHKLISNDGKTPYILNETNSQLTINCNNIDSTAAVPSSAIYGGVTICDKNGVRLGKIEVQRTASDVITCALVASRIIDGEYTFKSAQICINAAGDAWVENLRPNYGSLVGLGMSLGTAKTMPNDGVLFINIRVGSQIDSTVYVYDGSGHTIGVFKHNGGNAEFNCSTFTAVVAKGQSINCSWNNAGTASIVSSYLAPWR